MQGTPGFRHTALAVFACLSLSPILGCGCTIFQIDSTYPFISVNGQPIQWHSGAAAQWALSSLLVRIHPKGVMFKKQGWHVRDLTKLGWTPRSCINSAHGMCQAGGSVYFPSLQSPEVSEARAGECQSSGTNRVTTNTSRYDVSACDVIDALGDYVYTAEVMSQLHTALPSWIYWSVCVMVIFLIRCLSRYILSSLGTPSESESVLHAPGKHRDRDMPNAWASLAVSTACAILIVSQGDASFVTHEDLLFYWFTVFYIFAYTALFLGARVAKRVYRVTFHDPPFYNLIAGVLQLVATRLYSGAETPYNPPILFIVAVRTMTKSRRNVTLLRGVTLILDACMLALMGVLGFGPDPIYLVALFTGAAAWADLLVKGELETVAHR
jgi:hypothetical protein